MKLYFYFLENRSKGDAEICCEVREVFTKGKRYYLTNPEDRFPRGFEFLSFLPKANIERVLGSINDSLCIIVESPDVNRVARGFKADCNAVIRKSQFVIEEAKKDIARSEGVAGYIKQWEEEYGKDE